jgi:integrase
MPSVGGRFGGRNLRDSLATRLADNDVSLSVIQRMLRHSKPTTTAIYTHRINGVQMAAQAKFLDAIKVTSAPI